MAAGGWHSLGLKADGPIVAWGNARYGQCNISDLNGAFTTIATGPTHRLALVGQPMAAGDGPVVKPQPSLDVGPNPFTTCTRILYATPERRRTRLVVYDLAGRCVRTLRRDAWSAGPQQVEWNGRDDRGDPAPAAVYLVRLDAGDVTRNGRVLKLQ